MLTFDAANRLRQQLGQLPELLTLAHLALLPGSTPRTGRVTGGSTEAPLPIRLDVLDALGNRHDDQASPALLISWAQTVIYDRRRANDWTGWRSVPTGLSNEATASLAIRYLRLHHEFAIWRDYAEQYAGEIDQLHRALNRVTGQPITTRSAPGHCPRCHSLTLREDATGRRECCNPDCVAIYTPDEYASRIARLAAA